MGVTESKRPLENFIQFWWKKTDKIKSLSFIKRSRTLLRVESTAVGYFNTRRMCEGLRQARISFNAHFQLPFWLLIPLGF